MTDIHQSACPARGTPLPGLGFGGQRQPGLVLKLIPLGLGILMGAASVPSWTEGPRGLRGQESLDAPTRRALGGGGPAQSQREQVSTVLIPAGPILSSSPQAPWLYFLPLNSVSLS